MCEAIAEIRELIRMKENVRRSIQALELCWSCERICECEEGTVDDAAPAWLCAECRERVHVNVKPCGGASLRHSLR